MTQTELESTIADVFGHIARNLERQVRRRIERSKNRRSNAPAVRSPRIIDWDKYDLQRNVAVVEQPPSRFEHSFDRHVSTV